jgi:hypothetical protein
MMSAAILMTEAVEKVRVRRAYSDLSFDKGEPDGISFAKRFNEPVADSGLLQKTSLQARVQLRYRTRRVR